MPACHAPMPCTHSATPPCPPPETIAVMWFPTSHPPAGWTATWSGRFLGSGRLLASCRDRRSDPGRGALASLARTLALTLALSAAGPLPALESDQQQPLSLEADNAEMDEAKGLSLYTGKVIVRQGSLEIRADQVTIHHGADRKPELVIAIGKPATYQQLVEGEQKPIQAEALRMEYQATKDEITLIDQAVVFKGTDTFRSDRIVYDRLNARVKAGTSAQGKERVRIHITPPTEPKSKP